MKCNVGGVERGIRIVVGALLVSLVFVGPQTPWGWIGILPLATGIFGFCPAWLGLGINACKSGSEKA